MRTTEPAHYYPRPSTPANFNPHSSYHLFIENFVIPKTLHIYGTCMDTSQFCVVVYFEVYYTPPLSSFVSRIMAQATPYDVPENVLYYSVSVRGTIIFSYRVCKSTILSLDNVQYYVGCIWPL